MCASQVLAGFATCGTEQDQFVTDRLGAVIKVFGGGLALLALANDFAIFAEINCHAIVKGIERALPET